MLIKKDLRRHWRETYRQIPTLQTEISESICKHLLNSPEFARAKHVGIFSALAWEPVLLPLWIAFPKKCFFPKVLGQGMAFYSITSLSDLKVGYSKILEPTGHSPLSAFEPGDLILVPGSAYDSSGARVGSGRGFYDRFLAKCPAIPWGVCAFAQMVMESIEQEKTDVRMRAIVTERGLSRPVLI